MIPMMSGMCSVAFGCTVAARTPRPSASLKYSAIYFSATASEEMPSSLARFMILSSTSVKFWTNVTL